MSEKYRIRRADGRSIFASLLRDAGGDALCAYNPLLSCSCTRSKLFPGRSSEKLARPAKVNKTPFWSWGHEIPTSRVFRTFEVVNLQILYLFWKGPRNRSRWELLIPLYCGGARGDSRRTYKALRFRFVSSVHLFLWRNKNHMSVCTTREKNSRWLSKPCSILLL